MIGNRILHALNVASIETRASPSNYEVEYQKQGDGACDVHPHALVLAVVKHVLYALHAGAQPKLQATHPLAEVVQAPVLPIHLILDAHGDVLQQAYALPQRVDLGVVVLLQRLNINMAPATHMVDTSYTLLLCSVVQMLQGAAWCSEEGDCWRGVTI